MNRRRLLGIAASGVGAAGLYWSGLGRSSDDGPRPVSEARGGDQIVYSHPAIELEAERDTVEIGASIEFVIRNVGTSTVDLGCNVPWTIQRRQDGRWKEVLWTEADAFTACATELSPGGTVSEAVTISRTALDEHGAVELDLTPGQYRFVLLGMSPFLATDFRVV